MLRKTLGRIIVHHRRRRGWSQARLAKETGISLKYIGEIERGESNTRVEMYERIFETLECSVQALFAGLPAVGDLLDALNDLTSGIDRMRQVLTRDHYADEPHTLRNARGRPRKSHLPVVHTSVGS